MKSEDPAQRPGASAALLQSAVQKIRQFFEQLAPADLARLDQIYSSDARFKDPFNEVQGIAAIRGVFEHMFKALQGPRFVVHDVIVQDSQCFLSWEFRFHSASLGAAEQCIRGASHLVLAADGRITLHRDYWDAAEELYEKFPIIGALMRWLKRLAST